MPKLIYHVEKVYFFFLIFSPRNPYGEAHPNKPIVQVLHVNTLFG